MNKYKILIAMIIILLLSILFNVTFKYKNELGKRQFLEHSLDSQYRSNLGLASHYLEVNFPNMTEQQLLHNYENAIAHIAAASYISSLTTYSIEIKGKEYELENLYQVMTIPENRKFIMEQRLELAANLRKLSQSPLDVELLIQINKIIEGLKKTI